MIARNTLASTNRANRQRNHQTLPGIAGRAWIDYTQALVQRDRTQ